MGKQEAPFKDVMFEVYCGELQDHLALCTKLNSVLSENWTEYFEPIPLSVPRFLNGLEWEVGSILNQTQSGVEGAGSYIVRRVLFGEDKDNLFGPARRILEVKRFQTAKRLYLDREDDLLGLAQVSITTQVFREALRLIHASPEEVEEFLAREAFDAEVAKGLRIGLDYALFARAQGTRKGLHFGADLTKYASSEDTTKAILGALDSRVLRIAISKKGADYTEAARIITEHASSPQAREIMLQYLASRADKSILSPRSPKGFHYPARITNDFVEGIRVRTKAERKRVDEEKREARERERRAHREEERRRIWEASRARPSTGDRLTDAMSQVGHQYRKTLEACPRQQVAQAMEEVDKLRREQPGMSPRDIYRHLHRLGAAHKASEQAKTTAQIIGLFMEGRFSKDATLPF